MRVVHIVAGSGGTFYCENCMRDGALVKVLRSKGHDVVMVPMYLPIYTDDPDIARDSPVFFGGINLYLQEKIPLFRKTPRWVDRLFDSRWLLALAAKKAGSTRAAELGPMTLSMLRGEAGHQAKELDRMTDWLSADGKPDAIHVSTVLLLGLAHDLKQRLGAPVVYTMMDEDTWVDALGEPYARFCWEAMARKAAAVDAFLAVSRYYAGVMTKRLALDPSRVHVVPVGIDTSGYEESVAPDPPVIGYLSRMAQSLGLGDLVDVFIRLKLEVPSLRRTRLRVMGGHTGDDVPFIRKLKRTLAEHRMAEDAEFLAELDRDHRIAFTRSLSVLSVPVAGGEAFGTFILEALAAGVPVVQPAAGGFSELVEATGGGVLYNPTDPRALADALRDLLTDRDKARELGRRGRRQVRERYTIDRMADETLKVYEHVSTRGGDHGHE